MPIQHYFPAHGRLLLKEVSANHLRGVLTPAQTRMFEGHIIRSIESRNPEWYRTLCADRPHWRRKRTLCALGRIILDKDREVIGNKRYIYGAYLSDAIMREMIYSHLIEGMNSVDQGPMPPCNDVSEYFGFA